MTIVKTNVTDKKRRFALTHAQNARKVQDLVGQTIAINDYVLYKDGAAPAEGEPDNRKLVLSLELDGDVYGTISKTFIDSAMDIIEEFEGSDEPWAISIEASSSKNGRQFIYAVVV